MAWKLNEQARAQLHTLGGELPATTSSRDSVDRVEQAQRRAQRLALQAWETTGAARGERRAGIALAGIRPGAGRIHVTAVPGSYELTGETAWVTGWGLIDTLLVGAVDDDDVLHFFVMDAM